MSLPASWALILVFLMTSTLTTVKWNLSVLLNCVSLMANDVKFPDFICWAFLSQHTHFSSFRLSHQKIFHLNLEWIYFFYSHVNLYLLWSHWSLLQFDFYLASESVWYLRIQLLKESHVPFISHIMFLYCNVNISGHEWFFSSFRWVIP